MFLNGFLAKIKKFFGSKDLPTPVQPVAEEAPAQAAKPTVKAAAPKGKKKSKRKPPKKKL